MEKLQFYIVGDSQCKIFHKDTSSFIFRFIKSKLVVGCNDFPEKLEILLFHCFRENWWKPQSTIRQGGDWSKTRLVVVHDMSRPGGSVFIILAPGLWQISIIGLQQILPHLHSHVGDQHKTGHGSAEVVLTTSTDIKISFQHTMLLITHNTHVVSWQKYNF